MQSNLKTRAKKLLTGAVLAGLLGAGASQAGAALLIDIRRTTFAFGDPAGKLISIIPGGTVSMDIYLRGADTDPGMVNGLGSVALGVRSFNETENNPPGGGGSITWIGGPTPTNTVVNATGGTNALSSTVLDFGFSNGGNVDSAGAGSPDVAPDTDLDRTGIGGSQSSAGGWDPTYGLVPELLIGTAVFTAPTSWTSAHTGDYGVDLNAFFSTSIGTGGGVVIKSLTSTDTTTNGLGPNLITSNAQINGVAVHVVEPIPEPASLGLLGIAALGLLRRRPRA